ncbi:MAG: hypothetical protein JSR99_05130 [Proteobacteria bacterium]|nr:hypothetical protein [Pseudomonadota bacterium]
MAYLDPPAWVIHPATRIFFVFSAMLIWAWLMWAQSQVEMAIPASMMRRKSLTFGEVADGLVGVDGFGLTRSQLIHALLKAFWAGEFESRNGKSRLWLNGASTYRLVGGESVPVSGPTIDNVTGERMDTDLLASEPPIEVNRRYMLGCNLGISALYPNLSVVLPVVSDHDTPWREIKNDINFDILCAIKPDQYDQDYVSTYVERLNIAKRDIVRWSARLRDGRHEL